MRLIVITSPHFLYHEAEAINHLFDKGLDVLHIRKPESSENQILELLNTIPTVYHSQIVLHDAFSLANIFPIKGIHLNHRNHIVPNGFKGTISRSCHSLEEVEAMRDTYSYIFLSPIFDSISKEGYVSTFSEDTLLKAQEKGIITQQVIALGGIDEHTIPYIKSLKFGGVAVLGALWKKFAINPDINLLTAQFHLLQNGLHHTR